jgi:hypothetical protein
MDVDKFKYEIPGYVEVKDDLITGPALELYDVDYLQIEEDEKQFFCIDRLNLLKTEKLIIWSSLCDNEKYIWSQTPSSLHFENQHQDNIKSAESESEEDDDDESDEEDDDDEDEEEDGDDEDEEEDDDDEIKNNEKDQKQTEEKLLEKDLSQFIQDYKLNFTVKELQEFVEANSSPENPMSLHDLQDCVGNYQTSEARTAVL